MLGFGGVGTKAIDAGVGALREVLEGIRQVIGEFTSVKAVQDYLNRLGPLSPA